VTPERFILAMVLFHAIVLAASWRVVARWHDPERARIPTARWVQSLGRDLLGLALCVLAAAFLAPALANLDHAGRVKIGEIALRLVGQALFAETVVLFAALAAGHRTAARARALALGAIALALLAVYVEAYRIEPRQLRVRWHSLDRSGGEPMARPLRILHLTDIQTPVVGEHEARALLAGLASRPDLIVMTGDYVQDALGRATEAQAARDLRALMARLDFEAPLGVFATNGDAGLPCREVFAGTPVRCLVNETALVRLPDVATLAVTGLSRAAGRERDPAWLARLLVLGPRADRRIVISHAPDFVDALREPVDLVLAGHTHGGQVVVPFFGPPHTASRLPRLYAGGLHDYRGVPLHVSRGVGMERGFAPPVRFLCPPEICVLDVRFPAREVGMASAREPLKNGARAP
jgi:predicted MPP superfamily phosphohydrolase